MKHENIVIIICDRFLSRKNISLCFHAIRESTLQYTGPLCRLYSYFVLQKKKNAFFRLTATVYFSCYAGNKLSCGIKFQRYCRHYADDREQIKRRCTDRLK